jgi:hypothetical protein
MPMTSLRVGMPDRTYMSTHMYVYAYLCLHLSQSYAESLRIVLILVQIR